MSPAALVRAPVADPDTADPRHYDGSLEDLVDDTTKGKCSRCQTPTAFSDHFRQCPGCSYQRQLVLTRAVIEGTVHEGNIDYAAQVVYARELRYRTERRERTLEALAAPTPTRTTPKPSEAADGAIQLLAAALDSRLTRASKIKKVMWTIAESVQELQNGRKTVFLYRHPMRPVPKDHQWFQVSLAAGFELMSYRDTTVRIERYVIDGPELREVAGFQVPTAEAVRAAQIRARARAMAKGEAL